MALWLFSNVLYFAFHIEEYLKLQVINSTLQLQQSVWHMSAIHSNTQLQVNLKVCDNSEHMAHQICHKNTFKHCSVVHTNTTVTNIQYWLLSSWAAWCGVACNPPDTANTLMFQCSNLACRFQADNANKLGPAARPARSTVSDEGFLCSGSSRGTLNIYNPCTFTATWVIWGPCRWYNLETWNKDFHELFSLFSSKIKL